MGVENQEITLSRRDFHRTLVVGSAAVLAEALFSSRSALAVQRADGARPLIGEGVQCGDVTEGRAVVWSRTDRPSRMFVEYSTNSSFANSTVIKGAPALPENDFCAKTILSDLPPGQHIFYRVTFQDLREPKVRSFPEPGRFKTPSLEKSKVKILWSGDCCGQGFGINPDIGGMKIFDSMLKQEPDLFIHSGDTIYADHPIKAEIVLPDGRKWKNIVTEGKSKVAETQEEFRGAFRYAFGDENFKEFNRAVAQSHQWDDHEVHNNWYPGQILDDSNYKEKSIDLLSARAKKAFFEYMPITPQTDVDRVYRKITVNPAVDVFMLDERSYRGANSPNDQEVASADSAFLGRRQLDWFKDALLRSSATWKIIASDMPLSLVVPDGPKNFEAWANGDGEPRGRELELAELLRFIKLQNIQNVVWVTADVHYAAALHYAPERAKFTEFRPFWEFVAGPLNAGTYGPNKLDNTFGPVVKYQSVEEGFQVGASPLDGKQYFGSLEYDPASEVLSVGLFDLKGKNIYKVDLEPTRS